MRAEILAYLRNVRMAPPAQIARVVHATVDAVQAELHDMDDDGLVRLIEGVGMYRLSAKGAMA